MDTNALLDLMSIPKEGSPETVHIGDSQLPWVQAPDGSESQLLHVDLKQGLWVIKLRLQPGYRATPHYHTGPVFAVTLKGQWYYEETPDAVNTTGSYLFEPAHSRHTLVTPADGESETIVWFAIQGANINLDAENNIESVLDAKIILGMYRFLCNAMGEDSSRLLVVGEEH